MSKFKLMIALLIAVAFNIGLVQAQIAPPPTAEKPLPTLAEKPKTADSKEKQSVPAEQKQTPEIKLTAKDYDEMLAKLKKGETNIDFVKLRLAYTETTDYSPYGGGDKRRAMFAALREKDYQAALQMAEEMLKTNFVDVSAQIVAAQANTELGKTKEAEFHKAVFKGLINAITINDGKTVKTAMISLGISEQYFVMDYLGFARTSKALVRENNSVFDVHNASNAETKESRKFYFNIDKVFGRF